VERVGVIATFYLRGDGPGIPLGPVTAEIAFKPPTGAGLSADLAGVVSGGGFLSIDPERGRYAGLLNLNLLVVGVTAVGIIQTKPYFSLLVVITADFRPVGIDITFGFTINRVGGLIGLNRGADLPALRDAVRTNAISSALFPSNPVENAARIINDLDRMFPPLDGHVIFGPMIELGWGKPTGMFSLALGVVIQIPDPKIAILGILRVLVPPLDQPELALLRLQVNFLGTVDLGRSFLTFDASLFDSRLVMYTLEGDFLARLRWAGSPNFLASAGGFHPAYQAAGDMDVPANIRRIAIDLIPFSDNPRVRLESYYAVTSNTLQHGAKAEAYAGIGPFSLRGHLAYDILAQISPLHITAHFSALVGIFAGDDEIMGLNLDLTVEGPNPWRVDGEVSFKPVFFSPTITIPVRAQFGDSNAPPVPVRNLIDVFQHELDNVRNWKATQPDASRMLVQIAPNLKTPEGEVLADPSATLAFNQTALPLKRSIERFGGAKPLTPNQRFQITALTGFTISDTKSEFAPAQFLEIPEDQKLNWPSFVSMESGVHAEPGALVNFASPAPRVARYLSDAKDPLALDVPGVTGRFSERALSALEARSALGGSAMSASSLFRARIASLPNPDAIKIPPPAFFVVDAATLLPVSTTAHSDPVAANQALGVLAAQQPSLRGSLMVAASYEMV
jgi:hypothetical protein